MGFDKLVFEGLGKCGVGLAVVGGAAAMGAAYFTPAQTAQTVQDEVIANLFKAAVPGFLGVVSFGGTFLALSDIYAKDYDRAIGFGFATGIFTCFGGMFWTLTRI